MKNLEENDIHTHAAFIIANILIFSIFQFGWMITIWIGYTTNGTISNESLPIRIFNKKNYYDLVARTMNKKMWLLVRIFSIFMLLACTRDIIFRFDQQITHSQKCSLSV